MSESLIYVQMPGKWVEMTAKPKEVLPEKIIETIIEYYGISLSQVLSKQRYRPIIKTRHMIFYFLRTLTNEPLVKIAERLGLWDHTTVIHATQKIRDLYNIYPDVKYDVDNIRFKLTA